MGTEYEHGVLMQHELGRHGRDSGKQGAVPQDC